MTSNGHERPLVEFVNVTKSFGSTVALGSVSLTGMPGTVHAVTGENGAGKSTLMNLLAGVHQADAGEIRLRGESIVLASPNEARAAGISTIFQELSLLPNLTVAENMFLGHEPRRLGLIDRQAMRAKAATALERLGSTIDVDAYCGELSVAEQQIVEIARGITSDVDIFILDEPTAALNAPEVERLAALILSMKSAGKLVFYISHRLEEIFRFCDVISVMKDGEHVATRPARDLDHDTLVSLMVGRTVGQLFPDRPETEPPYQPLLSVRGLQPGPGLPDVSFDLNRGEILGLAGLEGQGQRAIIRAIAGLDAPLRGRVEKTAADGQSARTVKPAIVSVTMAGIGFVPEDRKTEGLYLPLSIARNMSLGMLREQSVWQRARIRPAEIAALLERMQVSATGPDQVVGSLSGGNQQKVMIGRWLASKVDVLLIEEPTRGVDVGAKAEIYSLLRGFADAGGAILFTTSELTELLGLCDRILVVRGGALVAEFAGPKADEETVMRAALSGRADQRLEEIIA